MLLIDDLPGSDILDSRNKVVKAPRQRVHRFLALFRCIVLNVFFGLGATILCEVERDGNRQLRFSLLDSAAGRVSFDFAEDEERYFYLMHA